MHRQDGSKSFSLTDKIIAREKATVFVLDEKGNIVEERHGY